MSYRKETRAICRGCLATDRTLTSIDNYYHIYHKIIKHSVILNNDEAIPLMCWECTASMRNFENFRKKVLEADLVFSSLGGQFHVKTLSTLAISMKQDIVDAVHNQEDKKHDAAGDNNKEDIKIDIELKEEPTDYKPTYDYDDYGEPLDFNDFFQNNDVVAENVKMEPIENVLEQTKHKVKSKVKPKKKELRVNYKVNYLKQNRIKMYEIKDIGDEEIAYWMEQQKTKPRYKKKAYKCEICISAFAKENAYLQHVKKFHNEQSSKYMCDICQKRFPTKHGVYRHVKLHYIKYRCKLCNHECYHHHEMEYHVLCSHRRSVECLKCGMQFDQFPKFYEHYRRLHKHVTCDYCGKNRISKAQLIRHIRKHHIEPRCIPCNKVYKTFDALGHHNRLHHETHARDLCFCVECNIQFDNVALYTRHIKRSVKHRQKKGVPCPECNNMYKRKCTMVNHYNKVHLKKTKHYCELCDKYFLTGHRLRQHTRITHDNLPHVKNKICAYCGRAFSNNRILDNHIRTHTGERPFECDYCPAAFTQKQALVSHTRAIHKILHYK